MKHIVKRIKKELGQILLEKDENDHEWFVASFFGRHVLVDLAIEYPFKPPTNIKIEGVSIHCLHNLYLKYITPFQKEKRCEFCDSILCPDNWSPCRTIKQCIVKYRYLQIQVADAIRMNLVSKNDCLITLPEDVVPIIYSYILSADKHIFHD